MPGDGVQSANNNREEEDHGDVEEAVGHVSYNVAVERYTEPHR